MWAIRRTATWAAIGLTTVLLTACATGGSGGSGARQSSQPAGPVTLAAAAQSVDAAQLKPGLAVGYSTITANHINDVISAGRGKPGDPVLQLNQASGSAPVLTSGRRTDVAANLRGYLQFSEPGAYAFKVFSNDGVRVSIDGQVVLDDPTVHAGRFSAEQSVSIGAAGYRKIEVLYFQKRGGSALQLYWRTPGGGDFVVVPASAFAH